MLLIRLKEREEFQKLSQGKAVFFSANDNYIQYFTPGKVNEIEVIYAFNTETPLPFREHYDFEDAKGIHVAQLTEIRGLYCFDIPHGSILSQTEEIPVEEESAC